MKIEQAVGVRMVRKLRRTVVHDIRLGMETIQVSRRSFINLVGFMPLAAELLVTDSPASPLVEIQSEISMGPGSNLFACAGRILRGPARLCGISIHGGEEDATWRIEREDGNAIFRYAVASKGHLYWRTGIEGEIIIWKGNLVRCTQTPDLDDLPWLTYSRPISKR